MFIFRADLVFPDVHLYGCVWNFQWALKYGSALTGLKCYDDTQWSDVTVRHRKHSSYWGRTEMYSNSVYPSIMVFRWYFTVPMYFYLLKHIIISLFLCKGSRWLGPFIFSIISWQRMTGGTEVMRLGLKQTNYVTALTLIKQKTERFN